MGYFSNGTEQMDYAEKWCVKCVHDPNNETEDGCPVMFLHWLHNYEECNKPDSFLHVLIPREGTGNGKCAMFHPVGEETPVGQ